MRKMLYKRAQDKKSKIPSFYSKRAQDKKSKIPSFYSKRAQVGETMTWIIATVIIVVLLLIFVYGSSLLARLNKVNVGSKRLFVSGDYLKTDTLLNTKTTMAYLITSSNKQGVVKSWAESNEINLKDYLK